MENTSFGSDHDRSISQRTLKAINQIVTKFIYGDHKISKSTSRSSITSIESEQTTQPFQDYKMENDSALTNYNSCYAGKHLTLEQFPQFCEQLRHLVILLRNIQADAFFMAEIPRNLQDELNVEAQELNFIYLEIKCVQNTINRLKLHKNILKEGTIEAKKNMEIENDELEKIEKTLNSKDPPLLEAWRKTKFCKKTETLDKLLENVKRNQEMLRKLEILIEHRISKIIQANLKEINERDLLVNIPLTE